MRLRMSGSSPWRRPGLWSGSNIGGRDGGGGDGRLVRRDAAAGQSGNDHCRNDDRSFAGTCSQYVHYAASGDLPLTWRIRRSDLLARISILRAAAGALALLESKRKAARNMPRILKQTERSRSCNLK